MLQIGLSHVTTRNMLLIAQLCAECADIISMWNEPHQDEAALT